MNPNKKKRILAYACSISAITASMAVSSAALAQIDTITVTSRKTEENVQDVPVAISVVDAKLIIDRGIATIADLDRVTPNLVFQPSAQSSFSQLVSLRGINATETLLVSQPSIGIYVDGVYQATMLNAGVTDTFDMNRAEVLKGPQGTLYGRNTPGGAILLHTNRAEYEEFSADVVLRGGNYDEWQAQSAINIPLGESAAMRLVGGYMDRNDGFAEDRTNGQTLEKRQGGNFRGEFRANLGERLEVSLRGDFSETETSGDARRLVAMTNGTQAGLAPGSFSPGGAATLAALDYGFALDAAGLTAAANEAVARSRERSFEYSPGFGAFEESSVHGYSGTLTYDLTDEIELKSITAKRGFRFAYGNECCDASSFSVIDNSQGARAVVGAFDNGTVDHFSQEIQMTGTGLDGRLSFAVGGFYFDSEGTDLSQPLIFPAFGGTVSITDVDVFNESLSGYAQASYEIVPNLRITGGVRYTDEDVTLVSRNRVIINALTPGAATICQVPAADQVSGQCLSTDYTNEFSDWSYTAGLDYSVNDNTMVYFRTSNGFKAGGINPRGSNTNVNFAPEDVTDYEIGLKTDLFDNRLRFNAAGFITQYQGFQQINTFVPPGGGITSAIINIDALGNRNEVDIKGFELDMIAQPTEGLTLTASFGHISPDFKSAVIASNLEGDIQGAADSSATASINYTVPVGSAALSFFGGWSWRSDVDYGPNGGFILADGTKFANDATIQEAFSLFDARVTLEFEEKDLAFAFFARNLTDKYYISGALDLASSLGPIVTNEGTPRQWGFEIRKGF